jgi:sialic acid synthase SpsE
LSKKDKPIILSTGMASLEEVTEAVKAINSVGNRDLVLLHCVSSYPASLNDANLRAMLTLKKTFQVPVGFSDHTLSLLTSVAAVAMGASLIEKHFTLNKKLSGPDHKYSFDVKQFREMVCSIRQVEEMFGSLAKEPVKAEFNVRDSSRRSITASVRIPKGAKIDENSIIFKAPANGISPKNVKSVIGSRAKVDIDIDEVITWEKIE